MNVKTLNRGEAQKAMEEWIEHYPVQPELDPEYEQMRIDLQICSEEIRKSVEGLDEKKAKYYIDYMFGLKLYEYLDKIPGFSMRVAANDDFWRFMSLKVIPLVVSQRWGKESDSHYWSRPTRIWLRSIWWYVHLAWQGDYEKTRQLLASRHFTTDTILNFEERSGRHGTHIEAYRQILSLYGSVSEEDLKRYSRSRKDTSDDIFRVVMKLNTARLMVTEPSLYPGGEYEYAKSLFRDAGVDLDAS